MLFKSKAPEKPKNAAANAAEVTGEDGAAATSRLRTLLPAAVLDPSGQASPAEQQPCRTAGARFTPARVLGRGRQRAARAGGSRYQRLASSNRSTGLGHLRRQLTHKLRPLLLDQLSHIVGDF
jgi:hypothetical protein